MSTTNIEIRGFTFIELIISIAVAGLLLALSIGAFSSFNSSKALDGSAEIVVAVLDEARSLTLASKDASAYGVHFGVSEVVLFTGATYNISDPNNIVTALDGRVTISGVTLNGDGQDVIFQRLTGETSEYGTATIALKKDLSISLTVTIYQTGIAQLP